MLWHVQLPVELRWTVGEWCVGGSSVPFFTFWIGPSPHGPHNLSIVVVNPSLWSLRRCIGTIDDPDQDQDHGTDASDAWCDAEARLKVQCWTPRQLPSSGWWQGLDWSKVRRQRQKWFVYLVINVFVVCFYVRAFQEVSRRTSLTFALLHYITLLYCLRCFWK